MKKICISKDWKFKNVSKKTAYTDIDLPHDYQIKEKRLPECSQSNGFYPDGVGEYLKYLRLDRDRHYILDIDGAYNCAHVTFNENLLAIHPYGYTPYLVDLTPYVLSDTTNKLTITTSPLSHSSRWYSGNGIYRDVFLWEGGDVRIEPWNLFVSTVEATREQAKLRLRYTVSADEEADVTVAFSVCFAEHTVKTETERMSVPKGNSDHELLLEISSPMLWDLEAPNLYTLKAVLKKNGETADETELTFGIRTITADVKNGLLLNGKPIKLRGGCIHHDHGELGSAAFPAAEERKVSLLKAAGFNAIRCAHNPPSLAFLEVCDRLGMVVMDEAFDCWNIQKKPQDYHLFFADWWARDISYMVLRDRNHPCVFSYSIGNEILEIDGLSGSATWAKKLSDEIRRYDDTKFVTSGIQKSFVKLHRPSEQDPDDYRTYLTEHFTELDADGINRVTLPYEQPLDIVGVNYYYQKYLLDHETYPDRVMWGSETRAIEFYHSWSLAKTHPFILGDFTWTAYDNMGEVGAGRWSWQRDGVDCTKPLSLSGTYPWRNCYQGDLDLCGYRRPQSYFREAVWLGNCEPRIFTTHPEHFGEAFTGTKWHWYDVEESWTYDDCYVGRPIKAETYTDADRIEWFVNGKRVGESIPMAGIASIETVYEKGSIRAVSYKDGVACSEYTLFTTDRASAIDLTAEKQEFLADGRDLCYVQISLSDRAGRLVRNDDRELTCYVQGGELLALFSGDPRSEDDAASNRCHTFQGHALAVIRTKSAGIITVTVCGDGLAGSTMSVTALLCE